MKKEKYTLTSIRRVIKLQGRRIAGSWGRATKSLKRVANKGTRKCKVPKAP